MMRHLTMQCQSHTCPANCNARKPVPSSIEGKLNAKKAFDFSPEWVRAQKMSSQGASSPSKILMDQHPSNHICVLYCVIPIHKSQLFWCEHQGHRWAEPSSFEQVARNVEDGPRHHFREGDPSQENCGRDPLWCEEGHEHREDDGASTPHKHTWQLSESNKWVCLNMGYAPKFDGWSCLIMVDLHCAKKECNFAGHPADPIFRRTQINSTCLQSGMAWSIHDQMCLSKRWMQQLPHTLQQRPPWTKSQEHRNSHQVEKNWTLQHRKCWLAGIWIAETLVKSQQENTNR